MNLKIFTLVLSAVAAQSMNPGADLSGTAEEMHAAYQKMPVERQRRFFVSPQVRFLPLVTLPAR